MAANVPNGWSGLQANIWNGWKSGDGQSIRNKNRHVPLDLVLRRVQANKDESRDCKKDQDRQKLTPTSISTIAVWLFHDT